MVILFGLVNAKCSVRGCHTETQLGNNQQFSKLGGAEGRALFL